MNESKIKKVSVKFPNFVSKDSVEYEGKRVVLKFPQVQGYKQQNVLRTVQWRFRHDDRCKTPSKS